MEARYAVVPVVAEADEGDGREEKRERIREVMIGCPETAEAIPTGVFVSQERIDDPDLVWSTYTTACSACHGSHAWGKAQVLHAGVREGVAA